ncbi:flagellar hook-length control protein FliK [Castellaniella sp. S9]|uniref:flagellar hook-length control protein FliK n=1 Tax=Castellaniella sp. S9 TaxID=2993652 RepID=UPI0022B59D86|nr:flagellar hook-length control protein FliK [Castellaniella sp. S9]
MSIGAPSNLGTLLIQRLDAVLGTTLGQQANLASGARPTAVTQPGNAENPGALQNPGQRHPREAVDAAGAQGRGQAAVGKSSGATALDDRMGRAATYSNTTASAPTTLGFAARIILALLAQYPQADPAVRGRTPLLDGRAARPGAAPPPSLATASTGQAATAGSAAPPAAPAAPAPGALGPGGALGAWTTLAGTLDPHGALAARLGQSLSQAVQGSGLFYESHLAALAFGKARAGDLAREPQARFVARTPGNAATGTSAAGTSPGSTATGQAPPAAGPQGTPPAMPAMPATTDPASAPAQSSTAGTASTGPAAQAAPAPQAPPIPGIDPQAHLLVRQQLEVLANQAFAWQGEAWPGAGMDWEIRRHARDGEGAGGGTDHWSTRLDLSLPALGQVQARLTLAGDQLVMRLAAPDSAERLGGAVETLRARLLAQGLRASQIAVLARDDADADLPPPSSAAATPDGHDQTHPA